MRMVDITMEILKITYVTKNIIRNLIKFISRDESPIYRWLSKY